MQIREANIFDIDEILDMLRQYRNATPLPFLREANDAEYISALLNSILAGAGIALVAEKDKLVGMLLAQISPSAWSPKHLLMNELAYWVNVDARGSTAGYRLLKAYADKGNELVKSGRIAKFFISKMVNSPDINYGRFGFSKIEESWGN